MKHIPFQCSSPMNQPNDLLVPHASLRNDHGLLVMQLCKTVEEYAIVISLGVRFGKTVIKFDPQ